MVKHTIKVSKQVSIEDYGDQVGISIDECSKEILLSLVLLRDRFSEEIKIVFDNFKLNFLLTEKNNRSFCTLFDIEQGIATLNISLDSLSYIIKYLLINYRDGVAEAEHIDIDFVTNHDFEVTLTIHSRFYNSFSGEEIFGVK